MFLNSFSGRRVFLTGHTGFKGSWLAEWLVSLGADVTGYSVRVNPPPDHFTDLGLACRIRHVEGDVRDLLRLDEALVAARPEFVFHLAAQPLVRQSYRDPVETITTNVTGTAHVLDALRRLSHRCVCVVVTSDKCYENREVPYSYRENDPLGGYDPYSASKAAAEIVAHSYRQSYFSGPDSPIRMVTARAGNVIGGGDWAADRIVPDCVRSLRNGKPIVVRNPAATRPWQHVLEPLCGYLWLAANAASDDRWDVLRARMGTGAGTCAFNFGPFPDANRTVKDLVGTLLQHWPGTWLDASRADVPHEAGLLGLAIDKAVNLLQWRPVWGFDQTVAVTTRWYREAAAGVPSVELSRADIATYIQDARRAGVAWTLPPDISRTP